MITGDLDQDRRTVKTLMACGGRVADHMTDVERFGVNAAWLLIEDAPARYPTLEEGLAWLAAQPDIDWPNDPMPGPLGFALVLHLHLAAFSARYETLPQRRWGACEHHALDAVAPVRQVARYSDLPPSQNQVDLVLWQTLCLLDYAHILGRDIDIELVDGIVHHALDALQMAIDPANGPADATAETVRPQRLRGLHALADLSLQRRNRAWATVAHRVAGQMLADNEPFPPSHRPWAWFAFAWSAHRGPSTPAAGPSTVPENRGAASSDCFADPLTLMLLADAAHAMGSFARPGGSA